MIDKNILKKIILEQQKLFKGSFVERDKLIKLNEKSSSDLIIIITGIRRCGKSVLLTQFKKGQNENDYYINFDDDRLHTFNLDDFEKLYEILIDLFGVQSTFYFDEIQNIVGWELFVRRLNDYNNKIYITGSNANLLSKELGTHLTGRYLTIELYPASFKEFLRFNDLT
ncbi:MAG TPA: ATP-binding protein, partial [Methanosarcinaceae archaeon]|nr:ATP-binding protein [Methanosarcinaceae archaeon]